MARAVFWLALVATGCGSTSGGVTSSHLPSDDAERPPIYELRGGYWFDGRAFTAGRSRYTVGGVFRNQRPEVVDSVIDLNGRYVVPPFADAHSHAFVTPGSIDSEIAEHLERGVFFVLNLTGSVKGRRAIAERLNHPGGVDVAYAEALTATRGHPILSAEVTANRIPWDSLRAYWPRLLTSRTAEGDVYWVLDSLPDLDRKWPPILQNQPDLIKVYLLDTERFAELRRDSASLGSTGLDPSLLPAIVARARRSGLRVAAHVETAADFRLAVRSGVSIIAHLPGSAPREGESLDRYELREEDAALAGRSGTIVVPTAWLAERLAAPRPWLSGAAAEGDTAQLERARRIQRRGIELLRRHGVPIAIGSDLFESAATEFAYLDRLGVMSRAELIDAWSRTSAETVFPRRRIGRLAPGYEANLLVVDCDPLARLECIGEITLRMKGGRLLTPAQ